MRVTPVPIPNTMVKTQAADGTSLETVRESRWLPEFEKKSRCGIAANVRDNEIDTGKDEQQLIGANLISKEVLL